MNYKKLAFSKGTPSVFFVESPFQLLCAVEAIAEFEITDYAFVLNVVKENPRNGQLFKMMRDLGYDYKLFYYGDYTYREFVSGTGVFSVEPERRYRRVFIGEYYNKDLKLLATRYAQPESVVVYLDDGNATVSIFKGISRNLCPPQSLRGWYWEIRGRLSRYVRYKAYCLRHKIANNNYFFTLFHDIPTRRFIKYPNRFSHLSTRNMREPQDLVLIIGTVIDHYCRQQNIPVVWLEQCLDNLLRETRTRFPGSRIVYVPHGRDTNANIPAYCERYGIDYTKTDCALEYYLIRERLYPKHIWGVNSTALFNLKKLLPQAEIHNIYISNSDAVFSKFFKEVASYYQNNGIVNDVIEYHAL